MNRIALLVLVAVVASASDVTFGVNRDAPFICKEMSPEVVGFSLSFSSEISKEDKRNKAIEAASATFLAAIKENADIIIMNGNPNREHDYMVHSGSFGLLSKESTNGDGVVRNSTFVMMKVKDGEDPILTGRRLTACVTAIKLNDDVLANLRGFYQGVLNANKYREDLVDAVLADAKKYGGHAEINGLEKNVMVSNAMNGRVKVFIPYTLSIKMNQN